METSVPTQTRFWQETGIFSIALLGLWSVILWPLFAKGSVVFFASLLAGTSGILLAMSFSLSSFSYYFDFLDAKVVYRKYLGLLGYFYALAYTGVVVMAHPQHYLADFPANLVSIEIGFGAIALGILTLMALVSNKKAIQILGGTLWKGILGWGYIAYALLVIRGIFLDAPLWQAWGSGMGEVFTVRMGLTILGIAVLLFRVSVPFHKKFSNRSYV